MTFFREEFPFSRPKFLMVFQIFRIFIVLNVVYDPFFTRKTTISEKNSLMTPFLLCSYFRAHPTTQLLKIFGGRMHGPSPTSNFGGPSPPGPGMEKDTDWEEEDEQR